MLSSNDPILSICVKKRCATEHFNRCRAIAAVRTDSPRDFDVSSRKKGGAFSANDQLCGTRKKESDSGYGASDISSSGFGIIEIDQTSVKPREAHALAA
jgi:hypothetical protein